MSENGEYLLTRTGLLLSDLYCSKEDEKALRKLLKKLKEQADVVCVHSILLCALRRGDLWELMQTQ